jgi:acyl-coenzyme A thioesterase PaaI-like protein
MPSEKYLSQLDGLADRSETFAYSAGQLASFLESFNRLEAMAYMGASVGTRGQKLVCVELAEIKNFHRGGLGTRAVNGAVISGLFDCGLGVAGLLQFPGKRCGTVELSVKFLRPVLGAQVRVYASATKASENMAFVEGMLFSGPALCATASGLVATSTGNTGS